MGYKKIMSLIKTIGYDQDEMIKNIVDLHCDGYVEADVTYSKGMFYNSGLVPQPRYKFDLYPQSPDTVCARAENLPLSDESLSSIMFDPPFLAGYTKDKPTGIIGKRFHGFRYMKDVWEWYDLCLPEFHRVLKPKGKLIFKCQDTVSSGKQWWSHVHVINRAQEQGYYVKDLFVLLARARMKGHNHNNQKHARKFHSYFLVLDKI